MHNNEDCIFCKIVNGELPCDKVYEDEHCIAFKDINPKADVHVLLIPRKHIASLRDFSIDDAELLSHLMLTAPKVAESLGLEHGFRTIINTGAGGGQIVFHVHLHILGILDGTKTMPFE